jgi:FtsP/CotA-like multicopper oxidase with cupredoxin domain
MGDLSDDDRGPGMGIVIEYAGATGKPQWEKPQPTTRDHTLFGGKEEAAEPDHVIDMLFAKANAADGGFNCWTINGAAYDMSGKTAPAYRLAKGRHYRLRLRNANDDIHPIHLYRHSVELTRIAGKQTSAS